MDLQMELFCWYVTESCKIFTAYATITDIDTDRMSLSVFYKELLNIYYICHNLHMSQSPTSLFRQ
jgi:hypothetical protein